MSKPEIVRSLFRSVAERVIAFAFAAMAIQLLIVFFEYYRDTPELARLMVEREAGALAEGYTGSEGALGYQLPDAAQRYSVAGSGYFARIRLADGTVLFSSCTDACTEHFLPLAWNPPDFWMRQISPGKPVSVSGGRSMKVARQRILIELAVVGDKEGRVWSIIAHELADHMVLPMSLMLVLVLGGILFSVRRSLRPIVAAAEMAHRLDLQSPESRLSPKGMPREIGALVQAINITHDRVAGLIDAQKLFTSAIGHELRTPLAAMKLDLGKMHDPRARRAEIEIDRLSHFVEQITALARLDGPHMVGMVEVDLKQLCKSRVAALAEWVYRNNHSIEFRDGSATSVPGDANLIETAIGNLIENAVRHTPDRTHIIVQAGPGPSVFVENDVTQIDTTELAGIGHQTHPQERGTVGLGLRIVEKIAALHGADFQLNFAFAKTVATLVLRTGADRPKPGITGASTGQSKFRPQGEL